MPPGSGGATGTVSVVLTDGSGAAQTIAVSLSLLQTGTTAPPFGTIDTPAGRTRPASPDRFR